MGVGDHPERPPDPICPIQSYERLMRQFRGTPFEPDLRQAIAKLGEMLPVSAAHTLGPEPSASANWSHWKHIAVMLISLEK
jgi:hypothetical protein